MLLLSTTLCVAQSGRSSSGRKSPAWDIRYWSGQSARLPVAWPRKACQPHTHTSHRCLQPAHRVTCAGLHLSVEWVNDPTGSAVQPGGICTRRRLRGQPARSAAEWRSPCQGAVCPSLRTVTAPGRLPKASPPAPADAGLSLPRRARSPQPAPAPLLPSQPPLAWIGDAGGQGSNLPLRHQVACE